MMEYPRNAITNVHILDGFSTIYYRIYVLDDVQSPVQTTAPSSTAHARPSTTGLSHLRAAEASLRTSLVLVTLDAWKQELWIFSKDETFSALQTLRSERARDNDAFLQVDQYWLKVTASGNVRAAQMVTGTPLPSRGAALLASVRQAPGTPVDPTSPTDHSQIFRLFMSALMAAIARLLLHTSRFRQLNSRTFLRQDVLDSDEDSSAIVWRRPPVLFILELALLPVGKITMSLKSLQQPNLLRLSDSRGRLQEMIGFSVWLAPSGRIARLVAQDEETLPLPSPSSEDEKKESAREPRLLRSASALIWKTTVTQWLAALGIDLAEGGGYEWLVVEVVKPLSSSDPAFAPHSIESTGIERLTWPSSLCFSRNYHDSLTDVSMSNLGERDETDPLDFSEKWYQAAQSRKMKIERRKATQLEEERQRQQARILDSQPRNNPEMAESLELLARTTNYVDLQNASMVYPTPPDGTQSQAVVSSSSLDGLVGTPANAAESASSAARPENQPNVDVGPGVSGTKPSTAHDSSDPTDSAIGTGMYDADGDEEMFGPISGETLDGEGAMDEPNWDFFDDAGSDAAEHQEEKETGMVSGGSSNADSMEKSGEAAIREGTEELSRLNVTDEKVANSIAEADDANKAQTVENKSEVDQEVLPQSSNSSAINGIHVDEGSPKVVLPLSPLELRNQLAPLPLSAPGKVDNLRSEHQDRHLTARNLSQFGALNFTQTVGAYDDKYGMDGRFWFDAGCDTGAPAPAPADKILPSLRDKVDSTHIATAAIKPQTPFSGADSDDESSDMSSCVESTEASALRMKRKRRVFEEEDSESSSTHNEVALSAAELEALERAHVSLLESLLPDPTDWSLGGYFSVPETRQSTSLPLSKEDTIKVAQILVDQVTQSSLDPAGRDTEKRSDDPDTVRSPDITRELEAVFGTCITPSLEQLIRTLGKSASAAPDDATSRVGTVVKIEPSHVRLRRGKHPLELLPSALPFWETFSFEPAHGSKDVMSFCITPTGSNIREGAEAFLSRLGEVYSRCSLGTHTAGGPHSSDGSTADSLTEWEASDRLTNRRTAMERLLTVCERLGRALSTIPASSQNLVVYFVNPFNLDFALVDLCTAFLRLFERYLEGSEKSQGSKRNEVVMQIVPLSFIASTDSLVIPTQAEYIRLALEIYDRCPPKNSDFELASPAPAVVLANPLPKSINFSNHAEVPPSLLQDGLQDGKCLHIAYSLSLDQRWITAAWTDNSGSLQMNMSYCLREKDSTVSRTTAEVIKEMWDATCEIMRKFRTRWRLMLVKDAPFDTTEAREWAMAASQATQNKPLPFSIVLISVDLAPAFSLQVDPSQLQAGNLSSQIAGYSTPVSTPQPNTLSPDQFGSAATPGSATMPANAPTPTDHSFEPDADTVLIDPSNESWGVVLSHRLNNSNSLLDYRPALASGYLMKRKGASDADGSVALGVNLVHAQAGTEFEQLMKEILGYYRGLATLTKAKGMVHPLQGVLPWHIATAVKGQQILSSVL